jgi:hypothetical protein
VPSPVVVREQRVQAGPEGGGRTLFTDIRHDLGYSSG